uniref:Uncharacterized protein n=1 Tax=Rhodnius prolixus TaxID=13249 RepID=T1I1Z5_RHOPR
MTEDYRLWFRERMYGEVEEELNREWRNRWRASTKGRTTFPLRCHMQLHDWSRDTVCCAPKCSKWA